MESTHRRGKAVRDRLGFAGFACVVATLAVVVAARDVPAQEEVTRKSWTSSAGEVSIPLPAGWDVRSEQPSPADGGAKLRLAIGSEGGRRGSVLWGYAIEEIRNARGRLVYELPWHMKNYGARTSGRCEHAIPNFWTETGDDPARSIRHVLAFRHVRRVAVTFVLEVPTADWETTWRPFLDGVAAADTKLEDAPPRPPGLRPVEKDGTLYLVGKGVKNATVDAFAKRVTAVEGWWTEVHGPPAKDPANPLEIVIYDTRTESEAAHTAAGWGMRSDTGTFGLHHSARILTWEFGPRDTRAHADFALSLWMTMHALAFDREPEWLREAQAYAAWLQVCCGKPLPFVPKDVVERLPAIAPRFSDLATPELVPLGDRGTQKHRTALLGYLAVFRLGPKPYQEAWRAFLAEMRASGDWNVAQKPLLALDQEALRREMESAVARFKQIAEK